MYRVLLLLLLSLVLAVTACSKKQTARYEYTAPAVSDSERDADLARYLLLDPDGNETIPRDNNGKSPFALLVIYPAHDRLRSTCSSTHYQSGLVVTAAHCVDDVGFTPGDYFVVFYNKAGRKVHYPITEFVYRGEQGPMGASSGLDLAVLRISDEAAEQWDTVQSTVQRYPDSAFGSFDTRGARRPPFTEDITMWVFSPFKHYPDILTAYPSRHGGVFSRKHCTATRTRTYRTTRRASEPLDYSHVTRENIWYDHCSEPGVRGNSGGYISKRNDATKGIGVVSRVSNLDPSDIPAARGSASVYSSQGREDLFDVAARNRATWAPTGGPRRNWTITYPKRGGGSETWHYLNQIYCMGTVFEALLNLHPDMIR